MKLNGGLLSHQDKEWVLLRKKWKSWNMMHPNEQVSWYEYYEANRK
tara:strand:- start:1058 stop:1195 length:138 start_codon:yes stop_codon:yes gene_type:complete